MQSTADLDARTWTRGPGREGQHGENVAVNAGRTRAPFAADPAASRGRLYEEPPSATRNDFRRDCDRIIHCTAFRRLTRPSFCLLVIALRAAAALAPRAATI